MRAFRERLVEIDPTFGLGKVFQMSGLSSVTDTTTSLTDPSRAFT